VVSSIHVTSSTHTSTRRAARWLGLIWLLSLGCSSKADLHVLEPRGGSGSSTVGRAPNGRDAGFDIDNGGAAAISGRGAGAASRGGTGGSGSALLERCDGVDNDRNGIVDDVDAQHDGVCDCLNIATIGEIGPWSDGGNVFKAWLNSRTPMPATELGDQALTDELLRPFQAIFVLYVSTRELSGNGRTLPAHHTFSDDEVAAFERWVRRGGGVMTTIGYTGAESSEEVNVNRLLAPLGMGYSTSKLELEGSIEDWEQHPLTDAVMRIVTMNGVEPEGPSGSTLARDASQRVALQVSQPDQGHVVVWGDEWITYDSQWRMVQDQQVERFWLNILKWLSPDQVCQVPIDPD
jgi:hypothetical protein